MTTTLSDPDKVLSPARFCDLAGISKTTLWRLQNAGQVEPPIRLSPNRIGWRAGYVSDWLRARRQGPLAGGAQ